MKKIFLFVLLFFSSILCFSQVNDSLRKETGILQRISHAFFWHLDYRVPVNKSIVNKAGHGLTVELNIGLDKKKNISVYGGWAFAGKLWDGKFNEQFASDFDNSLEFNGSTGIDSSALAMVKNDFHTMHGAAIPLPYIHDGYHEFSFYFGICFMPKNNKIPILKIYHGITRGVGTSPSNWTQTVSCPNGTNDGANYYFKRPLVWGANLCFRNPLRFLSVTKQHDYLQKITLSIYYELNDFSKSTLYYISYCGDHSGKIKLADFTSADFTSKYKTDVRFGFKIGFLIIKST